jgi:hypothetical protein
MNFVTEGLKVHMGMCCKVNQVIRPTSSYHSRLARGSDIANAAFKFLSQLFLNKSTGMWEK